MKAKIERFDPDSRVLTTTEASEYLGVAPSTMRRWARQLTITHYVLPGNHYRFRLKDLDAFAERNRRVQA
jgi:excisionase family DNA binding protein